MRRHRHGHFVKNFLIPEELGNGERRIFSQRQIKAGKVDPGEIDAVVYAVVVRIVLNEGLVPGFELMAEHQI